jgi:hypothetical protein
MTERGLEIEAHDGNALQPASIPLRDLIRRGW